MGTFFDQLRATQFPQLGEKTYADWTGAALPPASLINAHHDYLLQNLLGNPHSHHQPSATAMEAVFGARRAILDYFNAPDDSYEVIFTPNATGAIRLLEHYMFCGGELLMLADNHNSVNGLRETAKRNGAIFRYAPIKNDLTIDDAALERMLSFPRSNGHKLFAYPAKSNYTGTLHSLEWVKKAQEKGWDVLLDAAAYSANCRLDLRTVQPDFIPISFYKLFGYPTGLGCLIIRKPAYEKLFKRWFSGGSILLVSVMKDFFAPEALGYARFEDGTVNFTAIPAITAGLKFMKSLDNPKLHATGLATSLYDNLAQITDGPNAVILHSARGNDTVTFSVKRNGKIVDAWEFEKYANEQNVFVRTGCFCNPGVNEVVFGYTIDQYEQLYNDAIRPEAITIERLREFSEDAPIGAIRASFGYANIEKDIVRISRTVHDFLSR